MRMNLEDFLKNSQEEAVERIHLGHKSFFIVFFAVYLKSQQEIFRANTPDIVAKIYDDNKFYFLALEE